MKKWPLSITISAAWARKSAIGCQRKRNGFDEPHWLVIDQIRVIEHAEASFLPLDHERRPEHVLVERGIGDEHVRSLRPGSGKRRCGGVQKFVLAFRIARGRVRDGIKVPEAVFPAHQRMVVDVACAVRDERTGKAASDVRDVIAGRLGRRTVCGAAGDGCGRAKQHPTGRCFHSTGHGAQLPTRVRGFWKLARGAMLSHSVPFCAGSIRPRGQTLARKVPGARLSCAELKRLPSGRGPFARDSCSPRGSGDFGDCEGRHRLLEALERHVTDLFERESGLVAKLGHAR